MYKFSIVIPNYNKGKYVEECMQSIFNQTIDKSKFEVIVVDTGSTDNSVEIIKKFPVKLIQTEKKGAGAARNIGIENATGTYILFVDSDDYLTSLDVLEKLDNMVDNQDIISLSFTKDNFGEETFMVEVEDSIAEKIEKTKLLGCPTKCFKREVIGDTRFTENAKYEDVYFTLECLCKCNSYDYFKESFFTYRKVENSNTTTEVSGVIMTDLILEISKLYYLCFKYPQYKNNMLTRIKNDKLPLRLEILNELLESGENNFRKYF
jgi:glycosyltransferase involved in cell wall biosynthesis